MKVNFQYTKELLILNEIFNKEHKDNLRIVGGAVRNHLIHKAINDYDLSCKLKPEQSLELLEKHHVKTIPTGIKFGTVMAIINGKSFEITSTRKDIKTDGRHAIVEFTDNFEEDAQRRDFTFNALYLDFDNNIYDYFNGIEDLKNGIVRFIGDAESRIREDYLRILRFFRFYCYYAETMDSDGLNYSVKYRDKLKRLSGERIKSEMFKILQCNNSIKTLKIMQENNILQVITGIKDLNFSHIEKLFNLNIKITSEMALALMLNSLEELNILRERWRLSKKENAKIFKLMAYKIDNILGEDDIKKLLFEGSTKEELIEIIIINSIFNNASLQNIAEHMEKAIEFIKNIKIPTFPITGKDLQEIGITDAKNYKKILSNLKDIFIKSDFSISKEELIRIIKNFY